MRVRVWHYDGHSAVRHQAELEGDALGFRVITTASDAPLTRWSQLEVRDQRDHELVYGHRDIPGWRIGFEEPPPAEFVAWLPRAHVYGRWIDAIGIGPALIAFTLASAAIVLVVLQLPQWLAPIVPMTWEKRLGDVMVGDLGGRFCETPASQAALAALKQRLDPGDQPLEIHIANFDMVNAVALPGGKVVIFRGLIDKADSPDELAGVLAHEIGHVRKRHVMQSLLRQFGLSIVLGGANGQAGQALNTLAALTYSRSAEAEADRYSIERMRAAQISPLPTAAFFARLGGDEKKLGKASKAALTYISSHPLSLQREAAFRASAAPGAQFTPALVPAQWHALREACRLDKSVTKGDLPF